jgi:hypothetical protein
MQVGGSKLNWTYRTDVSPSDWNSRVLESDECCFFQTHFWATLLLDLLPRFCICTRIYEKDGVEVLVPVMKGRSIGPFSSFVSLPRGTFGGLLSNRPLGSEDVRSLLLQIVEPRAPHLRMYFSPLARPLLKTDSSIIPSSGGLTHVLDLEGGFEHVWRVHFSRKKRNSILSARRKGVEIERCRSLSLTSGRVIEPI